MREAPGLVREDRRAFASQGWRGVADAVLRYIFMCAVRETGWCGILALSAERCIWKHTSIVFSVPRFTNAEPTATRNSHKTRRRTVVHRRPHRPPSAASGVPTETPGPDRNIGAAAGSLYVLTATKRDHTRDLLVLTSAPE